MSGCKWRRSSGEWGFHLFDVGLSLGAMTGLGLCIPAPLAFVLGGKGSTRGGGGIGDRKSYVGRRHHVRQSRK